MKVVINIPDSVVRETKQKSTIIADARFQEMREKRNHRTDINQNRAQFQNGFLAEQAAYIYLKEHLGLECTEPDLELRSESERKHDADLRVGDWDISVKCDNTVPYSWVFGKNYANQIINEDYMHTFHKLVIVHKESDSEFHIVGVYNILGLAEEGYFAPPEREYLRDKKSCLYMKKMHLGENLISKALEDRKSDLF